MTTPLFVRRACAAITVAIGAGFLVHGVPARAAPQAPPAAARACQESLPDLYKRVSPSIVLIQATSIDPYDSEHRMQRVSGSGVIINASGLILTNSHVVFGRTMMAVTLDDGTTVPATPVGADPRFDVALIRIPAPAGRTLPTAQLGDSDRARVGDEVYAIGNPLGMDQTLTRGIVSAVNRLLPSAGWSLNEPLIQTDAAINPGNSGGPLVDRCGDIIGITTAIMPDSQNIGFAIPINLIKSVIPPLIADGRLIRPWVGVQGQFVPAVVKDLLRMPLTDGFLVEAVEPGSPAEKAGIHDGAFELTLAGEPILLGGDIITEVNGTKLNAMDDIERTLGGLKIGTKAQLTVFRADGTTKVEVTVVERPIMPWDLPGRTDAAGAGLSRPSLSLGPRLPSRKRIVF
jgi:serine protease Do